MGVPLDEWILWVDILRHCEIPADTLAKWVYTRYRYVYPSQRPLRRSVRHAVASNAHACVWDIEAGRWVNVTSITTLTDYLVAGLTEEIDAFLAWMSTHAVESTDKVHAWSAWWLREHSHLDETAIRRTRDDEVATTIVLDRNAMLSTYRPQSCPRAAALTVSTTEARTVQTQWLRERLEWLRVWITQPLHARELVYSFVDYLVYTYATPYPSHYCNTPGVVQFTDRTLYIPRGVPIRNVPYLPDTRRILHAYDSLPCLGQRNGPAQATVTALLPYFASDTDLHVTLAVLGQAVAGTLITTRCLALYDASAPVVENDASRDAENSESSEDGSDSDTDTGYSDADADDSDTSTDAEPEVETTTTTLSLSSTSITVLPALIRLFQAAYGPEMLTTIYGSRLRLDEVSYYAAAVRAYRIVIIYADTRACLPAVTRLIEYMHADQTDDQGKVTTLPVVMTGAAQLLTGWSLSIARTLWVVPLVVSSSLPSFTSSSSLWLRILDPPVEGQPLPYRSLLGKAYTSQPLSSQLWTSDGNEEIPCEARAFSTTDRCHWARDYAPAILKLGLTLAYVYGDLSVPSSPSMEAFHHRLRTQCPLTLFLEHYYTPFPEPLDHQLAIYGEACSVVVYALNVLALEFVAHVWPDSVRDGAIDLDAAFQRGYLPYTVENLTQAMFDRYGRHTAMCVSIHDLESGAWQRNTQDRTMRGQYPFASGVTHIFASPPTGAGLPSTHREYPVCTGWPGYVLHWQRLITDHPRLSGYVGDLHTRTLASMRHTDVDRQALNELEKWTAACGTPLATARPVTPPLDAQGPFAASAPTTQCLPGARYPSSSTHWSEFRSQLPRLNSRAMQHAHLAGTAVHQPTRKTDGAELPDIRVLLAFPNNG